MVETRIGAVLGRRMEKALAELQKLRRELADVRSLAIANTDYGRRLDRRFDETNHQISELKDDLELMLKSELSGWRTNLESSIDDRLDRMRDDLREAVKESE